MKTAVLGDTGTLFRLTVEDDGTVVNVANASTKFLVFVKPDGSSVQKTASFTTNGTDGKVQYQAEAGVLDQIGVWKCRAKFTGLDGWSGHSSPLRFRVEEP
jgi:hypothetical protein